jgi:hypothetical protein
MSHIIRASPSGCGGRWGGCLPWPDSSPSTHIPTLLRPTTPAPSLTTHPRHGGRGVGLHVPEPDLARGRRRRQEEPPRDTPMRPAHTQDLRLVPQRQERRAALHVPDAHRPVLRRAREQRTGGVERHVEATLLGSCGGGGVKRRRSGERLRLERHEHGRAGGACDGVREPMSDGIEDVSFRWTRQPWCPSSTHPVAEER